MYRALDVREVISISTGRVSNEIYGHGGSLDLQTRTNFVVIAENIETKDRKRFSFYSPYKSEFLGEPMYCGHTGDYQVLVPGDLFEVEDTNTWTHVQLITKETN